MIDYVGERAQIDPSERKTSDEEHDEGACDIHFVMCHPGIRKYIGWKKWYYWQFAGCTETNFAVGVPFARLYFRAS